MESVSLERSAAAPLPEQEQVVVLNRRRVYILPTRHGITFAFTLLLMLAGSINYTLGLGYVLTFLLASMAVVSILHTFRNLAGLQLRPGRAAPVFAGEQALFNVLVSNPGAVPRYSLGAARRGEEPAYFDVAGGETACVEVPVPAPRRGMLRLGSLTVATRYPLGLFRAWSNADLGQTCIVYPAPEAAHAPPPSRRPASGTGRRGGAGSEDYFGLRQHQPGDSPRHVAWKVLARGQGLYTKQFTEEVASELWLDWAELPGLDVEARLSRLTRWVLDAEAAGLSYGLRLPGTSIGPANGARHQTRCLEALALFEAGEPR